MIFSIVYLSSCKDDEIAEIKSANYSRNFSPVEVKAQPNQTNVVLTWDKPLNATKETTYTIIVSQDTLFTNGPEKTFESATNSLTILDSEIAVRKNYYARVRANEEGDKVESKWTNSKKFKITGEQYLKALRYQDITSTTVDLYWAVPKEVSTITLNGVSYTISSSEKADGHKQITGLKPSTTYAVVIYSGTADKGTLSFDTKAGVPSGNIINVSPSQDLNALLAAATSGDIFVLEQGGKYSISTITLPNGSLTVFGAEGPNKPILNVTGQINLPTTGGVIKFQNIHFSGYANGDISGTKRNYVINQSAVTSIEELAFENCEIRHLVNSPIRLQNKDNAKTIQKLTVNYCTVEDIGDNGTTGSYAFINNNVATSIIKNISITNSTFSKIGYSLIVHSASNSETVKISDCTFYNIIGDARFLVDYNTGSFGTLTIQNSIMGKTLSPAGSAGGIRGTGTSSITNTYKTNDFIMSATNPLTGIKDYAGASTALFVDPVANNFAFKDQSFVAKASAGDPRWR